MIKIYQFHAGAIFTYHFSYFMYSYTWTEVSVSMACT